MHFKFVSCERERIMLGFAFPSGCVSFTEEFVTTHSDAVANSNADEADEMDLGGGDDTVANDVPVLATLEIPKPLRVADCVQSMPVAVDIPCASLAVLAVLST